MNGQSERVFFLLYRDWTWWVWLVIAALLSAGLAGFPGAFQTALVLSFAQALFFLTREGRLSAFPVQLRIGYFLLLLVSYPEPMRWLYWLPAVGTWALVIFGYCPLARFFSLLPWNRQERLSADLLGRTWFSRPRMPAEYEGSGCAGGMCTIQAQVRPRS